MSIGLSFTSEKFLGGGSSLDGTMASISSIEATEALVADTILHSFSARGLTSSANKTLLHPVCFSSAAFVSRTFRGEGRKTFHH